MVEKQSNILNEEDQDFCEKIITLGELDAAIKDLNTDTSPGFDGLSSQFWFKFWPKMRILLFNSIKEVFPENSPPFPSFHEAPRGGVMTLLAILGRFMGVMA